MQHKKSYNPYVNHALDRQIGHGLGRLYPKVVAQRQTTLERNAAPLLALVCLCSMLVGWNLG